jgi:uncharacterized membrane protein YdbT with pleckstrin-like domain
VELRPHWSFLTGPLVISIATIAVGVTLDIAVPHTSVALHWVEGVVVAVPCLWLAARVARWRTTNLVLTNQRLVEWRGVLSPRQGETMLSDLASVAVVQSLARRIVGTGRLELELRENSEIRWIDDVRKPVIVQRVIHRRLEPYAEPPFAQGSPFD